MASEARQADYVEEEEAEESRGPVGIGGWLMIPVITLLVTAFGASHTILQTELGRVSQEILAGNLILVVGAVALLALMYSRSELVPMLMVVFYVVLVGIGSLEFVAVDRLLFGVTPEVGAAHRERVLHDLQHIVAVAIIWIPYFFVSRRVKNTFVR